jgi:hypothetical protein
MRFRNEENNRKKSHFSNELSSSSQSFISLSFCCTVVAVRKCAYDRCRNERMNKTPGWRRVDQLIPSWERHRLLNLSQQDRWGNESQNISHSRCYTIPGDPCDCPLSPSCAMPPVFRHVCSRLIVGVGPPPDREWGPFLWWLKFSVLNQCQKNTSKIEWSCYTPTLGLFDKNEKPPDQCKKFSVKNPHDTVLYLFPLIHPIDVQIFSLNLYLYFTITINHNEWDQQDWNASLE